MRFSLTLLASLIFVSAAWGTSTNDDSRHVTACLNELAASATDMPFEMGWAGGRRDPRNPFGWSRLTFTVFDAILLRANVPQSSINAMKTWLTSLRLSQDEGRAFGPDDPALIASFSAAGFFRLNQADRELYTTIVPYSISDRFNLSANVIHIAWQENYYFLPEPECCTLPRAPTEKKKLKRPYEALLLRQPSKSATERELKIWIADLVAAMCRWNDLGFISQALHDARPTQARWLAGRVGADERGEIALASPFFPLFIETRAEGVRAWVLHRLLGTDWEDAWNEGQDRALDTVEAYTPPELMEPYLELPEGVYRGHTSPLGVTLRGW